jgi:hypothetical protein
MKKVALFVLASAMLLTVSAVSQAGDCNSCCPQKSFKLPTLKLPKLGGLMSLCKPKCEPCCAAPTPTCAAPSAAPAPAEAAPAPKPPVELSPSAADQPKR